MPKDPKQASDQEPQEQPFTPHADKTDVQSMMHNIRAPNIHTAEESMAHVSREEVNEELRNSYQQVGASFENTALEEEVLTSEDYPLSLDEVTTLPAEEDEFHMIDYLMGHTQEEQQP
jgi:hypothetical protein